MISEVYVVSSKGRRTGKLYQRFHAAKRYAEHINAFRHYHPVRIHVLSCKPQVTHNITEGGHTVE